MSTQKPILYAEEVAFSYGRQSVLMGVTLDVHAGELLGLVGPNGAGKSTLLACLHGAAKPKRGRVVLEGADLSTLSEKAIARGIGVVPQNCDVPFPVSVEGFVGLGRYPHESWLRAHSAADAAVVRDCLERMELAALAQRSVNELSGGEFRRVLIAQALAQEPRVLLLDEPVQQLDLLHQIEVMELARAFTRRDGTVGVVVLHDLGLAARYCDRIALLHGGALAAMGTPDHVITPAHIEYAFGVRAEVERNPRTGLLNVVPLAPADKDAMHTNPGTRK